MTLRTRIASTLLDGQTLSRNILDRELKSVLAAPCGFILDAVKPR